MVNIRLADVSQGYGRRLILSHIDLELAEGQVLGLLGPNGAGKTTLLRTLATILPPQKGQILYNGVPVDTKSVIELRRHVGYLPQSFGADPSMRVSDFVRYAAWMRGVPSSERNSAVDRALTLVDLVDQRRSRMKTLSGGMRQRAGIAWAIVGNPGLVLLDEPTVGLDPRQRLQFRKIVSSLNDCVVVLSTHLIDDIDAICDRVAVLHSGVMKFVGTTQELSTMGSSELPGDSAIERAYMNLMPAEDQRL